ncbi:polyprenyl synthetase family protein [Nocardia sp. NPDC046473]|uniref:polyprenyl synthetase family protein n=1 Tax=Nocardia sp. NPDC046473 TaxID=3155733 RepID=UPI0033E18620
MFEPAYRAVVSALPPSIARIGGYHIGWWDAAGNPTQLGGKAFRPALVLTTAAAMTDGGPGDAMERAIAAAVAIEMVHDFSLLHDDVMDGDRTRRHRAAAWAQFGLGPAILTGDMFLTAATDLLASKDIDDARILTRALCALCEGQTEDLSFETQTTVALSDCVHMVEGKTSALLSAACELGARAAGTSTDQAALMHAYGFQLGMAFQLVDDLLGIWGDPQRTGKPVYSDLVRRKKSLPVVAAMNSGTPAGAELQRRYADPAPLEPSEPAHLARLIELSGSKQWAENTARESCSEAGRLLRQAHPRPEAAADLRTLADLITRREY